jgi:hypothetical protein
MYGEFFNAGYESGELYGFARDDMTTKEECDRIATVLVYLEAPEAIQGGGETLFTRHHGGVVFENRARRAQAQQVL